MAAFPDEGMPKFPPIKNQAWIVPFLFFVMVLSSAGTLFYEIGPDEVGVVQRFGKYVRTTNPGLHLRLPLGIETVKNIKVTHVFKEEFGFRTASSGTRSIYQSSSQDSRRSGQDIYSQTGDPFLDESLMLTGDLNVAVVEWIVQFTVKDPVAFSFNIRDIRETIRNMSEAVMRLVIGDHTINEVLSSAREDIQADVVKKLQEVLDNYKSGISINNVILQDVTPPDEVKPSFNEVNEARQEKEKAINQAWEAYNKIIPRAKGEAEKKIREAEGYALERINRAQGEAKRFDLTFQAYQKAPEVTRQRLYLETIAQVYPKMKEKWVMDDAQKNILPFLNLQAESRKSQS